MSQVAVSLVSNAAQVETTNTVNQRTIETFANQIFAIVTAKALEMKKVVDYKEAKKLASTMGLVQLSKGRSGFAAPTLSGLELIGQETHAMEVLAFVEANKNKAAQKEAANVAKLEARLIKAKEKLAKAQG